MDGINVPYLLSCRHCRPFYNILQLRIQHSGHPLSWQRAYGSQVRTSLDIPFFVSIFFYFLNQLMILFWLLVRLCPSFCCSSTSLKPAHLLSLPWAPVLRYEKIFSPCIAPFQSSVPLTGMWYVVQPPYRMKWEITLLVAWQYWGLPSLWTLWWSAWWLEWEPCQVHAAI